MNVGDVEFTIGIKFNKYGIFLMAIFYINLDTLMMYWINLNRSTYFNKIFYSKKKKKIISLKLKKFNEMKYRNVIDKPIIFNLAICTWPDILFALSVVR